MRVLPLLLLVSLLALPFVPAQSGPEVVLVKIDGVVTQGTTLHVKAGIAEAESRGVPLVLQLDTPGGLVDATLEIHQAIVGADVPVLTWVGPPGGFAASAGTLILLMGEPNAMAPSTTIGSAQPINVGADGGSEPAGDKVENFLVGQIRSMAERTGRDPDTAERFITENLNMDPDQALASGMVDVVAADLPTFLNAVHGRMALVGDSGSARLDTSGARIIEVAPPFEAKVVDILSNPQIAFLLVAAGTYALILGLANPGSYVPETIGALLLLLGFIGIGLFSTSTAGILLLLLALIFFVAEVFTPTHGVLSVVGVIAMIFAVIFLLDEPLLPATFLRRFMVAGIVTAVLSGTIVFGAVTFALRSRKRPVHDVLMGAHGTVIDALSPAGRVTVHGEVWNARSDGDTIPTGERVVVRGHEGLWLDVDVAGDEEE